MARALERAISSVTSGTNDGLDEDVDGDADSVDDDVGDGGAEYAAMEPHEEVIARFRRAAQSFPADFLSESQIEFLCRVVRRHPAAFGRRLRPEPIRCDPVTVDALPDAVPVRAGYPMYNAGKKAALDAEIAAMVEDGVLRERPGNDWALPVFVVPKGKDAVTRSWRVVTNCQPLDKRTRSVGNEPLDQRAVVARVGRSKYRGAFDVLKAFWQIAVAEHSQRFFGIKTDRGVYVYRRLPMGWKNSPALLQLRLDQVFAGLEGHERWVDDVLVHASDFPSFARCLEQFLARCEAKNVVMKPTTQLVAPEVTFVGLRLTQSGYSKVPSTFGAVRARPVRNAADLSATLGFFQFFTGTVPGMEILTSPLRAVLTRAQAVAGSSAKLVIKKVELGDVVGWRAVHATLFERVWQRIEAGIEMAFPDPRQRVMLITDASDFACAGIIMQCDDAEWAKPPAERRGQVLYVYSRVFTGAECRWTVAEKELHPLHHLVTKMEHILLGRQVVAYTDHLNLVYLLQNENVLHRVQAARRVGRRIMEMSAVHLTVEHIAGINNVFADYLSRGGESELDLLGVRRVKVAAAGGVDHMLVGEYAFPSKDLLVQHMTLGGAGGDAILAGFAKDADGLYKRGDDEVFVPESLRGAFLVAAHCGTAGHRGVAGTLYHLGKCTWPSVREDVERAVRGCVHCARADVGTVPRPLGAVFHGTRVGQALHIDYIDFPEDRRGRKKVLVAKDDVSQCVFAYICDAADSGTTAAKLREFITTHSLLPEWVVSDQGSHFAGALTEALKAVGVAQKTHLPYTPQANGTIERANKELVRTVIALLSERGLMTQDWPDVLDLAVMAVNNSPSEQLGGATPHQVFTGRGGMSLTQVVAVSGAGALRGRPLTARETVKLAQTMRSHFSALERSVAATKEATRVRRRAARDARRGAEPVDFGVGDYVLVSAVDGRPRDVNKLEPRWQGPAAVLAEVSPLVFDVKYVGSERTERVHAQRLRFFDGPDLVVGPAMLRSADLSLADRFVLDRITELSWRTVRGRRRLVFTVEWAGYGPEAATYEPVVRLHTDVPAVVEEYLAREHPRPVQALVEQARRAIVAAKRARERQNKDKSTSG